MPKVLQSNKIALFQLILSPIRDWNPLDSIFKFFEICSN